MSDGSGGAPQLDERGRLRKLSDRAYELFERELRTGPGGIAAERDELGEFLHDVSAEIDAYLAASPGAGGLDLTDEEIRALFKWLNAGSAGVTATESEVVFYQSARSKLRARLDRKDEDDG